jgi:hypothetical protein
MEFEMEKLGLFTPSHNVEIVMLGGKSV